MTPPGSTLSTDSCLAAIERHSRGLARAARGNLDAPVEHCPGWSVADLVRHVTDVHWFWATIAEELPSSPPDASRRPSRPADGELVDAFEAGSRRLVDVLGSADALQIRVADSGDGVPAGVAEQVFERGWSTKAADGPVGRGLGLALVVQAVRKYDGHIDVGTSAELGGAEFDIRIGAGS